MLQIVKALSRPWMETLRKLLHGMFEALRALRGFWLLLCSKHPKNPGAMSVTALRTASLTTPDRRTHPRALRSIRLLGLMSETRIDGTAKLTGT